MRTFLKSLALVLAVVFTVSAGSLMAQGNSAQGNAAQGNTRWMPVAVKALPVKVMTGYRSRYSHSKILKAEKSGAGATVLYRLTIQRKDKSEAVLFDAEGNLKS